MTTTVEETTQAPGAYALGQAGSEGSAPSMDEAAATDGQAATPGNGRPDSASEEGEGGDASQEAPERAAHGRQESKVVRELKEQRRRRRGAEEAAAYWRGVAEGRMRPEGGAALRPPSQYPSPGAPLGQGVSSPDPMTFERFDDYEEVLAQYPAGGTALDAAAGALAGTEGEALSDAAALPTDAAAYPGAAPPPPAGAAETDRAFAARIRQAAAGEYPEVLDIVNDATLHVSKPMAAVIKASDAAPALLRYLAQHREEARRIYDLAPTLTLPDGRQVQSGNPLAAAMELGRIASRLSAGGEQPQTRRVSSAPEPVVPVGGAKGAVETDDERVPIEEFVRRRNEAQYSHLRKRR